MDTKPPTSRFPTQEEWDIAIREYFTAICLNIDERILNALIPIERNITHSGPQTYKVINYIAEYEMGQLCETLNGLHDAIQSSSDENAKTVFMLFAHTHILEADKPYMIMYNMLRLHLGLPAIATFLPISHLPADKIIDKPLLRIEHMAKHAKPHNFKIFNCLSRLWVRSLRNSFLHAQYFISNGDLIGTRAISPLRMKGEGLYLKKEEVAQLYESSRSFLLTFLECCNALLKHFQSGKAFPTDAGWITFDRGWRFVQLPDGWIDKK